MQALALHPDVLVVTSALLQVNCVIVRGDSGEESAVGGEDPAQGAALGSGLEQAAETFVIDSPVLPDELDALPAIVEQSHFPAPNGLLITHGDWDHLLGPLAFSDIALGCAESTAERLAAEPGAAQRELRAFDEDLMIRRARPLALGSIQALPVPGRCDIGGRELELHAAGGHSADGMAIWITWAHVLVAGDYLSAIEIPTLAEGKTIDAYLATLERLRAYVEQAEWVVPGHGPVLDRQTALGTLEEDIVYLRALVRDGAKAELPDARGGRAQRELHARNIARQEL